MRARASTRASGSGRSIIIISPAGAGSRSGNSVTALRYSRILGSLGYRVRIFHSNSAAEPPDADLLVALHARKSARAALRFARRYPGRPIVVVLTGTDIYRDLSRSRLGMRALELADAIVSLQPLAIRRLPRRLRAKARTIWQSVDSYRAQLVARRGKRSVRFCVLGHLRREKDPLRAAYALRMLPGEVRVEVVHAGGIVDAAFAERVRRATAREPRYRYLGELSRSRALALLRRSDALVLSSRLEGGANVASEAIALGVPVVASRIEGNVGMFGSDYAGYYAVGSTRDLARVMQRFVADRDFARRLRRQVRARKTLVAPARERRALGELVNKLFI